LRVVPTTLDRLLAQRAKRHRLEPPRPIRRVADAIAFVRSAQVVMQSGQSSLPTLTQAIVGHTIRGSWMADPEVHRIYDVWQGVASSGEFVETRAILGKQSYVIAGLAPALVRVGLDADIRADAVTTLTPVARALLDDVEQQGEVRFDTWEGAPRPHARRARDQLVHRLLVEPHEEHTAAGHHINVLLPWRECTTASRHKRAAAKRTTHQAQDDLIHASIAAAVIAPTKEIGSWTLWAGDTLDRLLNDGRVEPVDDAPDYVVAR
jgi:hypothetical protein